MDDKIVSQGKIMDKYSYQKDMWSPVPMLENCDHRYSRNFSFKESNQQQKESNPDQETSK